MVQFILKTSFYVLLGFSAMAANKSDTSKVDKPEYRICQMHQGDVGKIKVRAKVEDSGQIEDSKKAALEKAFSEVTHQCFEKRTSLYMKREKGAEPTQDLQIQWAQACANAIQCN